MPDLRHRPESGVAIPAMCPLCPRSLIRMMHPPATAGPVCGLLHKLAISGLLMLAGLLSWTHVVAGESTGLRVGVYQSPIHAPIPDLDTLPLSAFRQVEAMPLTLHGDPSVYRWLRIDVDLHKASDPGDPWVLRLGRVGVERLKLFWPRASGLAPMGPLDFYHPHDSPIELSNGYGFELPEGLHGPVTLYLQVNASVDVSLTPQLLPQSTVVASERRATIMFTAIYTGLILLGLTGIALFGVLRDRVYLNFIAYVLMLTLSVLVQNGHLYLVPGLATLQSLGSFGPSMLRCLLAATMLALMRPMLALDAGQLRVDALLRWASVLALVFAAGCAAGQPGLERPLQILSCAVLLGAVVLCVLASGLAMLLRRHLAGPLLLMWLLVLAAGIARLAIPYGLLPPTELNLYGDQIAGALSAFLLSIALADRIIAFRQQRDRARLAQMLAASSLRIEQERRKFVETLHTDLRHAADGDHDGMSYRLLIDTLVLLIPQAGCAVMIHRHGSDQLLVSHPHESKERFATLFELRRVAIRGICRSQVPMQMHIEQALLDGVASSAIDSHFAVLPLPLALPGWGALLIERHGNQVFSAEELQLAREFAAKAAAASEEAASSLALRHSAEFDALTGAFNRRAVDHRLENAFEIARDGNSDMSVLFIDLDRLKEINDMYGHAVGDRCLRLLAETVASHCGGDDMFGRYGGDEFVVVLSGAGQEQAKRWADKLIAATRPLGVDCREGFARLSISIGVSSRMPVDQQVQQVVERADKALYAAKRLGRDRVQTFESLYDQQEPGASLH